MASRATFLMLLNAFVFNSGIWFLSGELFWIFTMLRWRALPCSSLRGYSGLLCPVRLSHFPWKSYVMMLTQSKNLVRRQIRSWTEDSHKEKVPKSCFSLISHQALVTKVRGQRPPLMIEIGTFPFQNSFSDTPRHRACCLTSMVEQFARLHFAQIKHITHAIFANDKEKKYRLKKKGKEIQILCRRARFKQPCTRVRPWLCHWGPSARLLF